MDEVDIEEYGLCGILVSIFDWYVVFLDCVVCMVECDKNYFLVVMWSMGNESGYGFNFVVILVWLYDFDFICFVYYEGVQGVNGEFDLKIVDVISCFYICVKQEYLNFGIFEGEDKEWVENVCWECLLEIVECMNDNCFVMISEYVYCMGNVLGNFKEYWDEIYSNLCMLGGFIWDWVD